MKIRLKFVSNSSSGSFLMQLVEIEELGLMRSNIVDSLRELISDFRQNIPIQDILIDLEHIAKDLRKLEAIQTAKEKQ